MKTYKKVKKTVSVVKSTRCNKCGKDITLSKLAHAAGLFTGCSVEMRYGYGSIHDGDVVRFDLCDKCSDEFLSSLKHEGEITEEF